MNDTVATITKLQVPSIGDVEVTLEERGQGQPFLLLHGGAGPQSMAGFAELLADRQQARVLTPIHPGFNGTPRPDALRTPAGLAAVYRALLDDLDVDDVTVIGDRSVAGSLPNSLCSPLPGSAASC